MLQKHPVPIITGPTASGKSAHALRLAQSCSGVILNADAMQLYREAPILTAQPDSAELASAPHRLYGVLDATDPSTAARWASLAAAEIRRAWAEGLQPILVGGTGMYIKALMQGMAAIPPVPPEIRSQVREWQLAEGNTALHAFLQAADPVTAIRLAPGDSQRILRAVEVFKATGRSISDWQELPATTLLPEAEFQLSRIALDRDVLYARIDARFIAMIEQGGLAEAKALHARHLPLALPLMKAVGIPELFVHLDGKITLAEAIRRAQQHTRNYAKRQETWLRGQFPQAQVID